MDPLAATNEIHRNKHGEASKLTISNYYAWNKAIRYILLAANAWSIVAGDEIPPDALAANANVHTLERYEDKRDDYNTQYNMAAATIYQSCSATVQAYLADYPTPTAMWQTLRERLDKGSNENGPTLLRDRLNKVKFDGEGSISAYITKVLEFREQLTHTQQALSDQDVISHLLTNLPPSWLFIRTIIANQLAATKTLDYVINSLINSETDILTNQEPTEKPTSNALFSVTNSQSNNKNASLQSSDREHRQQGRSHGRGLGRGGRRGNHNGRNSSRGTKSTESLQGKYWWCLCPGHKEDDCHTKKAVLEAKEKRDAGQKSTEAGFASVQGFMADAGNNRANKDEWYIDSGVTDHLCSYRTQFTTLQRLKTPLLVHMGDSKPINTTSIGTITLYISNLSNSRN